MEKEEIEELAMAVAMVEHYQEIIDSKKDKIRNLSEEEIAKINKGNNLLIKRQDYTKTIYSKEYKEAVAKIAEKFPPEKETLKNHTIKLQATSYTISKQEIIANKLATQTKTQLAKVASKIKRG